MLRAILRNVQFTLLLSASLLVLLAFQRLQNDDLFMISQFQHTAPHLDRHDIIGVGRGHSKIFSTNVIQIGLFRFVVPFRWVNDGPDGEDITAAGPKPPTVRRNIKDRRKKNILHPGPRAMQSDTHSSVQNDGVAPDTRNTKRNSLKKGSSVAYLVPVPACPPEELELTEGLAVLRQSIVSLHTISNYTYRVSVVISDGHVDGCNIEQVARNLGFEVITLSADDLVSEVLSEKHEIDSSSTSQFSMKNQGSGRNVSGSKNGGSSVGTHSSISGALVDYDITVLLRMDSLVMRPLDDLFGAILHPREPLNSPKMSQLLIGTPNKEMKGVEAFMTKGSMDLCIAKRDWEYLFPALLEMLGGSQANYPINATLRNNKGRSYLTQIYTYNQQQQSQQSILGLGIDENESSVLWLDACRFSRRKKDSSSHCDYLAPFDHSLVSYSGSCSPPWGCSGHKYGSDTEGDYCEGLHRVWFQYRTQLDLSSASDGPTLKQEDADRANEENSYGTYCKHGGLEGYARYKPQHIRSRVARLLRSIGRR
mmetsp:Transcript_53777/g.160965  ORF Transcript_53777/g.160965 Transcript_53777/m.160965 type:complete len:536 (-) Transcript_53777:199-1806(-)